MRPIRSPLSQSNAIGVLFAEDFDDPPGVTVLDDAADAASHHDEPMQLTDEAELPEIDIESERAVAYSRGRLDAIAEIGAAASQQRQEQTRILMEIAELLRASEGMAETIAERSADAVAQILLSVFHCVLPTLCARFGNAEAVAVARAVVPALRYAPSVTIQVHRDMSPAFDKLLASLDLPLRERIQILNVDTGTVGDIKIDWPDGGAARDATSLWSDVTEALEPLRLIKIMPQINEDSHD